MKSKQLLKDTEEKVAQLGEDVLTAGRSAWLASLGAVAEADEQGRGLFDDLVAKGRKVQSRRKEDLDAVLRGPRKRLQKVGEWASGTLRESVDGVTRRSTDLLQGLGLPTYEDVRTLNARVAELNRKVEKLARR